MAKAIFPEVTLLITHYNRSESLERLLRAFEEQAVEFGSVVVSDDGSQSLHLRGLEQLKERYGFQLITTPRNQGLGHNINKGQRAVQTPYTLYVQEDFVPTQQFPESFGDALGLMHNDATIDLVRFYAYYLYPYLRPYNKDFSETVYHPWYVDTTKIYSYSDHPHLRKSSFLTKFGDYKEGIKSDKTEYLMCLSFIQRKGKALFYNNYQGLFTQENTFSEPSTVKRTQWKQSSNFFIRCARTVYRQIKYNLDLNFKRV